MPIPTFTGLPPNPSFEDLVRKLNTLTGEMQNLFLTLDSLNVVSLTADHVDTGTLDAALVTIKSLLTAGAYIQIDGTGMKIFDGTKNTFIADITGLVTMTGALVQTAAGYPKVELNSATSLIGAYQSATNYISIEPSSFSGNPGIRFHSPLGDGIWRILDNFLTLLTPTGSFHIQLGSGSDLFLTANNAIKLEGASLTIDNIVGYTGSFSVITGVDFTAQTTTSKTVTVRKGIVTSVS